VGWCGTHNFWGSTKGNNCRDSCLVNMVAQDHPNLKCSESRSNRTQLPNTLRTSKITFAVCGHAPSCWKNVLTTYPALWMNKTPHFVITAVTDILMWCPPQRSVQ
jgi:hypothetical protein